MTSLSGSAAGVPIAETIVSGTSVSPAPLPLIIVTCVIVLVAGLIAVMIRAESKRRPPTEIRAGPTNAKALLAARYDRVCRKAESSRRVRLAASAVIAPLVIVGIVFPMLAESEFARKQFTEHPLMFMRLIPVIAAPLVAFAAAILKQAQARESLLMHAINKADELIALPVAENDEAARDARVARLLRHALEIAEHRGRDLGDLTRG